ncbi:M48 family metallopeptidase [Nonomuraea sp. NPDC048881]|uniref:M48 family metallopeptidase n=1 Tax=Nonomuraea sp. NPDC048881 TaxID=3155030 RepID=UPI0033D5E5C6
MPRQRSCPRCDVSIEHDERYPAWCPSCGWNLPVPQGKRSISAALADRLTAGLHADTLRRGADVPKGKVPRALSYLFAGLIHLIAASAIVTAGWTVVTWPNVLGVLLGAFLLFVAWLMRPRLGRVPSGPLVLTRHAAPRLYDLTDRIGAEIGADRVDLVVVTPVFNASFEQVGPSGRRVLTIGAPLWALLEPQQRVALLAHELSHSSNGDSRHDRFTRTALGALAAVHRAMRGAAGGGEYVAEAVPQSVLSVLALVLLIVMRVAGLVVRLVGLLLLVVTMRSARQAEYVADERSARIASSAAAAAMLDLVATADVDVNELAWMSSALGPSVWEHLRERQAAVPDSELERRRRIEAMAQARLDDSHPPLPLRVEFVRSLPHDWPLIRLRDIENEAIEAELAPLFDRLATELGATKRHDSFA